jgi:hypothetical protein
MGWSPKRSIARVEKDFPGLSRETRVCRVTFRFVFSMSKRALDWTGTELAASKYARHEDDDRALQEQHCATGLLTLPSELVRLEIARHLGIVSRVRLTWTCSSMRAAFRGQPYAGDSSSWMEEIMFEYSTFGDNHILRSRDERTLALSYFEQLSRELRLADWRFWFRCNALYHCAEDALLQVGLLLAGNETRGHNSIGTLLPPSSYPGRRLSYEFSIPQPTVKSYDGYPACHQIFKSTTIATGFDPEDVALMRTIAEKRSRERALAATEK